MKLLRRGLLLLVLTAAGAWLAASAALAYGLPVGWHIARWPVSIPGLAATSPEGVTLRWSPVDWRGLRLAGQNFTPRGSRLGSVTALDAEVVLRGPPGLDAVTWRLAGGHLEITGLSVLWGPLRFSGAGTLWPSEDDALTGSLRGRMEGGDGALGMLARAGMIGTGGRAGGEVELPLAFHRDGRVMLGPLLVAQWR